MFRSDHPHQINKPRHLVMLVTALFLGTHAYAADETAAKDLARQNGCFRCHSVSHAKDGPAWKDVADKLRGNPGAEAKLIHHITSGEPAKFPDGHVEKHKIIQSDNPAQIKNLVDWILSLK